MLSKEQLQGTLQKVLTDYLQQFLTNNFQNKCTDELITGMAMKLMPILMQALEPWIPKNEEK